MEVDAGGLRLSHDEAQSARDQNRAHLPPPTVGNPPGPVHIDRVAVHIS